MVRSSGVLCSVLTVLLSSALTVFVKAASTHSALQRDKEIPQRMLPYEYDDKVISRDIKRQHTNVDEERYLNQLEKIIGNNDKLTRSRIFNKTRKKRNVSNSKFVTDKVARRYKRASISNKDKLWTYGVIPYEIDANYSGSYKSLFKQAMRHWENYTCISFVERNPDEHSNYILFTETPCGCCSYVGMKGTGKQIISIGKNCDKFGNVVHELGHVVGFWHEHTRPDRDQYITVIKDNIMHGQEYNFNIMKADEIDSLKTKYDYTSVMHYSTRTFSKNPYLETIQVPEDLPEEIKQQIGQRNRLSTIDILQANLLYNCPVCGKTFQGHSANFSSASFIGAKPPVDSQLCVWRIQGTHGEKIVLNVTELDIAMSPNCTTDYLEIIDGYWHKSKVLKRICGSEKLNESIISSESRMLVKYVSSNPAGHRGFAANYIAVCGGELFVETEGKLESPNYPMEYRENTRCIWKITVPEKYQVALTFHSFEVENHDKCYYDYVELRDGITSDSPVLGTFCGSNIPPDVRSTSNTMWIKFSSDGTIGYSGFSAKFLKEYDECKHIDHGCAHECINTLGSYKCSCKIGYELNPDGKNCDVSCGGILETVNGSFTSPSYPEFYPDNKQCIWEIRAPPGHLITLNFTYFDLEDFNYQRQQCGDRIEVYSKTGKEKLEQHGSASCGTNRPRPITSKSNILRIVFVSDQNIPGAGFSAVYYYYLDKCSIENFGCDHYCTNNFGQHSCSCRTGYILGDEGKKCIEKCVYELPIPAGQMHSPNYPNKIEGPINCAYHHRTLDGHRVRVRFIDFELDDHFECMYDYVQFYNGDSVNSMTLSPKYCGTLLPQVVQTFGNEMLMDFKSTYGGNKGFQATYSTICGGILRAEKEKRYIYSHVLYDKADYPDNAYCSWRIEPVSDFNVRIQFLFLDLEPSIDCEFDFVDILDDLEYSEDSIGRFCGNEIPDIVESEEGPVKVIFKTDSENVGKGFLLSYEAVDPPYISSELIERAIFGK